jgi:signal transduction histidine kinase
LVAVVVLYFYFYHKVFDKIEFKRFTIVSIILGFLFNFAWEVIQIPLFKDASFSLGHILFCALASIADVIMVLLLYYGFAVIYKNPMWIKNLTALKIIVLMMGGGIGAVLAEMRHVSQGNWSYSKPMPIIPIVEIGLSPVLQFMILPALVYSISLQIVKK